MVIAGSLLKTRIYPSFSSTYHLLPSPGACSILVGLVTLFRVGKGLTSRTPESAVLPPGAMQVVAGGLEFNPEAFTENSSDSQGTIWSSSAVAARSVQRTIKTGIRMKTRGHFLELPFLTIFLNQGEAFNLFY